MDRLDELMIVPKGETLRIGQSHLKFAGQFVHSHGINSSISNMGTGMIRVVRLDADVFKPDPSSLALDVRVSKRKKAV
ncbi:MAG: hypothetical protein MUF20_02285 [Methylotetracoccus sp.]|nr:hypothetical protein [Methylotetracoccus sp.]